MRGLRIAAIWLAVLACASAKTPDNFQPVDAAKSPVDAGVKNDAASHPIDAPSATHHDAASPDAFVSPDADTSGAICTADNQCTTTGQCCLIITSGTGICTTGTVVGGTCLPF